jgi:hypothetical protein
VDRPLPSRRGNNAAKQRRNRHRRKRGLIVVPVEIDGQVLDMLIKMRWITEEEATDTGDWRKVRAKIGIRIGERLARSAGKV